MYKYRGCYFSNVSPENYWKSKDNRRNFFIEFASKEGFDPLIGENWNNVKCAEALKVE